MKNNTIFLGFFVIVFGVMMIIGNINLFFIFPIFLVFIGLSIMPKKSLFTLISTIILMVACFSLIVIDSFKVKDREVYSLPLEISETIENPVVNLLLESGEFKLSSNDSDKFILGHIETNFSEYKLTRNENNIFLSFTGLGFWNDNEKLTNKVDLFINDKASLNLESFLSSIEINDIEFDKVKIHNTAFSDINFSVDNSSEINIDSFVSSIKISIPQQIGVKLIDNTKQSSLNLGNMIKVGDNEYQTLDYEEQEEKVFIQIDGAFSSLTIINK